MRMLEKEMERGRGRGIFGEERVVGSGCFREANRCFCMKMRKKGVVFFRKRRSFVLFRQSLVQTLLYRF